MKGVAMMADIVQAAAPGVPADSHAHVSPATLRDGFRRWPTGVAVITGFDGAVPVGMTCNSLTSISLEPPLLAVCVANGSASWPGISRSGRFCVNVLAHDQEHIGRAFATRDADRFHNVRWQPGPSGPALADALLWFDCSIFGETPAGDHTVVLALIHDVRVGREGQQPLVFHAGRFVTVPGA